MTVFVCIASGPSLTAADCLRVRPYRTIAVNESWRLTQDIVYAGDFAWWQAHSRQVPSHRSRWTRSPRAAREFGLQHFAGSPGSYNSGQQAIELAIRLGATRVLLLGYDCSCRRGLHWHGPHAGGLRNPASDAIPIWVQEFERTRALAGSIPIINCSRDTELPCFQRATLESELSSLAPDHRLWGSSLHPI